MRYFRPLFFFIFIFSIQLTVQSYKKVHFKNNINQAHRIISEATSGWKTFILKKVRDSFVHLLTLVLFHQTYKKIPDRIITCPSNFCQVIVRPFFFSFRLFWRRVRFTTWISNGDRSIDWWTTYKNINLKCIHSFLFT